MQFSVSAVSKVCVARADSTGSSNSHSFAVSRVPLTAVGFILFLPLLVRHLRTCHEKKKDVSVSRPLLGPVLQLQSSTFSLTLSLLMSYIYGAPSKARNANVVYIWTYVWQR